MSDLGRAGRWGLAVAAAGVLLSVVVGVGPRLWAALAGDA